METVAVVVMLAAFALLCAAVWRLGCVLAAAFMEADGE